MKNDQASFKMKGMQEMVKKEFIKCQTQFINPSLSLTQKNNGLNNLKLLLTQSKAFFPVLEKEFVKNAEDMNFFKSEIHI